MKNRVFEVIARTALISVGALLLFDAAFLMLFSNIHSGLFLTLAVGALLSLFGILYNGIYRKIPKFIKLIFYIGITAVALFVLFLLLYGSADTADYTEDALIVLGAGVNGEELSQDLKNRLDRALEYYKKNPDAVFVLSGGKGPQEDITEALAMQRYLTERGVPEENILKEEKATSTYENFVFSAAMLDDYFGREYSVAFVTNDFHMYRAKSIALIAGIEDAKHLHSATEFHTVFPSCIRECLAVVKLWVLKK